MNELILYALAFGTVVFFVLTLFSVFGSRENSLDRLDEITSDNSGVTGGSILKDDVDEKFVKLLKPFKERLVSEDVDVKSKRANMMVMAGYYKPTAFTILYATRFVLAILFAGFAATYFAISPTNRSPLMVFSIVIGASMLGYFLPILFIKSRIEERQKKFRQGLPDAMDMLLVSLEAGLSFPASLKHVAHETREVHPMLSEQFEMVTLEFQAGRQRAEALKNLSDRVDIPEIHGMTTMIIQSEELGTSLVQALRAAASDLRRDRMLKAEEKANALPVKMSLPLVGCIFPTLFAIILVPVIIKITQVL